MNDSESISNSNLQQCCWVKNLMIDMPNFAQSASFLSLLKLSQTSKEMRERLLPILKTKRAQELLFLQTWFTALNRIYNLDRIIQQHCCNLEELNLSSTQITKIPPEIGQLINLKSLNLSWNEITKIPPEIGQLTNLKRFYIHQNKITVIPPEIGLLTHLKFLHLDRNYITEIPPEIGILTQKHGCNLIELYLIGNPITKIPPFLNRPGLAIYI